MCLGILNFTKKYSNKALEECCNQAIALNKQKYTFIKNTISVVADDLGEAGYRHSGSSKSEPVRRGYVMPPEASSIDTLLSRSKALLKNAYCVFYRALELWLPNFCRKDHCSIVISPVSIILVQFRFDPILINDDCLLTIITNN